MCVLFPPAAASLVPTEQLVLTTLRQEASDLQDPGQGATLSARLTDRFDKSEFARIRLDDATFVSGVLLGAWPPAIGAGVSKPPALKSYMSCYVSGSYLKLFPCCGP